MQSLQTAPLALLLIGTLSSAVQGQTPPARAEFEVASIKQNVSGERRAFLGMKNAGTFSAENVALRFLIQEAYGVRPFQIVGGPPWVDSDRFDVAAKPAASRPGALPANTSTMQVMKEFSVMLQPLLEERFQLKVHRETKELPVYTLSVAKGGAKLQKADCLDPDSDNPPPPPVSGGKRPNFCGDIGGGANGSNRTLDGFGITIKALVERTLPNITGRVVIDKTGLTETFNVHLEWSPDIPPERIAGSDSAASAPGPDSQGPSIFTALQAQLGLKLESAKGPVDVVVIDHVEKLSAN
jgi:uncharacterized protein (TIGR03435 family)